MGGSKASDSHSLLDLRFVVLSKMFANLIAHHAEISYVSFPHRSFIGLVQAWASSDAALLFCGEPLDYRDFIPVSIVNGTSVVVICVGGIDGAEALRMGF